MTGDDRKIALTDADRKDIALAEYKEVADQFRKLTEIRFMLLTYLPLGTAAAAVFVAKDNDLAKHPEISAFAFVVTLCIATYNKRNDQFYDELVKRAAELEKNLQVEHGSFSDRPKAWLKYGSVPVEHRWPIGLVYAAAAGLWAFLFVDALDKDHCWLEYLQFRLVLLQPRLLWLQFNLIWLKFFVPVLVIVCWRGLRWMERGRKEKQRKVVERLMERLLGLRVAASAEQAELADAIAEQPILGFDKDQTRRRVVHHWNECEQKQNPGSECGQKWNSRAASALRAAVLDLPARWIEDVWTGRR